MKFKLKLGEHYPDGAYNTYGYLFNSIRYDADSVVAKGGSVDEAVDWEIDDRNYGGIIVFSTDVNAVKLSENRVVNWIKQKVATIVNRISYNKKLDKIAKSKDEVYAWTVGKYLHGRYKAKNGQIFDENSISVEILNISSEVLIDIAEEICRDLNQETVLVKDITNRKILFVNGDNN